MKERFVVGRVEGYNIGPNGGAPGSRNKVPELWQVHDTAYCWRTVAEFRNRGRTKARDKAEALAAKLNAEEAANLSSR